MKALDKDRARRYETVNSMALDIRRHLVREPILAHPPSALYRTRKFLARHRVGATFTLTISVLLAALGVATAIQSVRIAEERNRAVKEAERAKAINSFLQSMLASANPMQGHKRDVTVFEEMGRVAGSIDGSFAAQPEIAAELKHTMGVTYLQLGYYEEAERMLTSSLALYERLPGVTGDMLAEPLTSLAVLFHERGDYDRAEVLYRRALAVKIAASGEETTDALSILSNLALLLQDKGDLAGAEPLFRRILALDRKRLGSDHEYVANDLDNLGNLLLRRGDLAAAEPLLRESLAILEKHESPWIATVLGNIGDLTVAKEGYAAARPIYAQAVDRGRRDLGDRNQDVAKVRLKYGKCLAALGVRDEAERELRAAHDVLNASAGPENERTREASEALKRMGQTGW
jgi:tetratricopeptide (TPR) repeat protein